MLKEKKDRKDELIKATPGNTFLDGVKIYGKRFILGLIALVLLRACLTVPAGSISFDEKAVHIKYEAFRHVAECVLDALPDNADLLTKKSPLRVKN